MGNDEDHALIGIKVLFEDRQRRNIQIVRRFVQEKDVRLAHEQAQKVETAPFTAA